MSNCKLKVSEFVATMKEIGEAYTEYANACVEAKAIGINLRNILLHFKPNQISITIFDDDKVTRIVANLVGKSSISETTNDNIHTIRKIDSIEALNVIYGEIMEDVFVVENEKD